ncbi:MAG: hypothetical protein P4L51_05515 [Puia sp.]|nr:hypothetical protein [Puia sp.]
MGNPSKISILLLSLLSFGACKKNNQTAANINASIVGEWTWTDSGFPNSTLLTSVPGVQHTLLFTKDGTLYITHNDSTGAAGLQVQAFTQLVIFPKAIVDTETFRTGYEPAACVSELFPTLTTVSGENQFGYQYSISGDTLQIANSPCLAPFTSFYVRK